MKNKNVKEETIITKKQKITLIICTLLIILVCLFMYKENSKLVKQHPEYSTQGVSEERRDNAEKILNSIISINGSNSSKISEERIYSFSDIDVNKETFYGDISNEIKLLSALGNTSSDEINGEIPYNIKEYNYCSYIDNFLEEKCNPVSITKTIDIDKLKETYQNMFGTELTNFLTITNNSIKYIYDEQTNKYYIGENNSEQLSNKTYYVYYNNYNSPYEHPELATVEVSVLCVELENNGKLYRITDLFNNLVTEHLSKEDMEKYVKNTNNYSKNEIKVTYNFDNNSPYGLTLSTITKINK